MHFTIVIIAICLFVITGIHQEKQADDKPKPCAIIEVPLNSKPEPATVLFTKIDGFCCLGTELNFIDLPRSIIVQQQDAICSLKSIPFGVL